MSNLASLRLGYVPWTSSALRPTTCEQVVNDIIINRRRVVVEFGAGVSSIVLACLDRELDLGLQLWAIEEDKEWLDEVSRRVASASPSTKFRPIHAKLDSYDSKDGGLGSYVSRWYSRDALKALPESVDLLLCDGPTAFRRSTRLDRWPALPEMYKRLNRSCAVLLDDTNRKGEARIMASWASSYPEFKPKTDATWSWLTRGPKWNA